MWRNIVKKKKYIQIDGKEKGLRIESRILEEKIQDAVEKGARCIEINAFGQHGIGGRLWKAGNESIHVVIKGHSGQRVGSFGFPNTCIEVIGPASDDAGWLNAGSQIIIHGNAGNGLANAMAQGKIFVAGNIGARGMTMTKSNPRFEPPEIWVLGSAGDYFGEFMAGGIAVICGIDPQTPENILGYRPLVGMVGGRVYFRGPHKGYSHADAKQIPILDDDWTWFSENLKIYLEHIKRNELLETLLVRDDWQLVVARTPQEKSGVPNRSISSFRADVWDKELGRGGLIGDLTTSDRSPIPLITTGVLRRFVPVWENQKYLAPCETTCPTGIPVHKRWRLIREGRVDEAVDLALEYTPFPATICGYLCPNPCMQSCTRLISSMMPIDISKLGKASINARLPEFPKRSGKKIAVIGGGPAGISIAWQLRKVGHEAVIYDMEKSLGGKMSSVIPESRIPKDILAAELERISRVIPHVHLKQKLEKKETERLSQDYEFLVFATGTQNPRTLPIPGKERMMTSLEFLLKSKANEIDPGKQVVIIGAGNVGCDVATEAGRLGAENITLIDVQEPASFGKEREDAEAYGAIFKWPCFTKEITKEGVWLQTGELIPADTVVISIGDLPDTSFLPERVEIKNGFVSVDEHYRTSDPKIFAIGDMVKPGLLTDAIGAGRKAAEAIIAILKGEVPSSVITPVIDTDRISLEYFDPRIAGFDDLEHCGSQCSSCGNCRDCGICITICPQAAISRKDLKEANYQYVVDDALCIGCGFCVGACPCGIWNLVENEPID
jgi:NADPH-dependent glutamate synthase beta subunit-like oxidoreductase/glutamate synthase domain-containing protein 3/NAD-dependent dihydropyrimidine dehydrogenase PreA subunit